MKNKFLVVVVVFLLGVFVKVSAQQDPQYTQYMYNTQVVNPAYAGSKEALSLGLLYRSQWVGLDGAPKSFTFNAHTPIGYGKTGIGLSIVRDEIGPSEETFANVDFSYTIQTSEKGQLAFGLKAGANILNVDFTRLNISDPGDVFENNIDNKINLQIGAGAYYYTDRFYMGLSVPNFLESDHFDEASIENADASAISKERLHYFFITGYVFDLSENVKFKPAILTKVVTGSPLQIDGSANFLFYDRFTLGAAYRWSASWSAMVGFQITDSLLLGFAYDRETTDLSKYNDGSYEFYLRYEIFKNKEKVLSPRFF
ncbi:PorP/SprF family type IX secretion system membrane protein [Planktosalinus lacus]|uniref:Membrane protein n=1 Tax=Planktosalinus lacus TaxID=1526573 RepID=A0A8J2VFC4_9FLAO|nr:type IX secretion system membrane protein PorP/SprF [Planktosalinus lacus]GGE00694.1 membrane protein [Planktosalinus lacus]